MQFVNPLLERVPAFRPGPTSAAIAAETGLPPERLVKLSSNEAPLGASPLVGEALRELAAGEELHRYPDPVMPELRAAVAARAGVEPESVLLADGSSETWPALIRAYSAAGDGVLRVEPSQRGYSSVAWLAERAPRVVEVGFPYDPEPADLLAAVDERTRLIFLSSPNNTTSRLLDHAFLRALAAGAPDALVVVDEHYIEAAPDYERRGALPLLAELPNLVVTRTFSKMYGLAALRVGYALAAPEIVAEAGKLRSVWALGLPAERAALAALADSEHLERNIAATHAGREQLLAGLAAIEGAAVVPEPDGGFLAVRLEGSDGPGLAAALLRRGVIVRGDLLDGWIRVSVGLADENERFLEAFAAAREDLPVGA